VIRTKEQRALQGPDGTRSIRIEDREQVILPDSLVVRGSVSVEERRKGIYRVPLYRAALRFEAAFTLPERFSVAPDAEPVGDPQAFVAFRLADARGLRALPVITAGGAPLDVRPGSGTGWLGAEVAATLDAPRAGAPVTLGADLELVGTERLALAPLGAATRIEIDSDWPHPGFEGGFLPDAHQITGEGFSASWRLSRFATGVEQAIQRPGADPAKGLEGAEVAIRFVQPVDVYRQTERAMKYGMLFVVLTFMVFFLFEILRGLSIHPLQYALCAAALAIFFLLVLSLSEHVPFGAAYATASAACVGLITTYVAHVLRSASRTLVLAGMLSAMYGVLYVILLAEDYALLLGTVLLFGALAALMLMTRRIDWYRAGQREPDDSPGSPAA
jgi:inner membrane protein